MLRHWVCLIVLGAIVMAASSLAMAQAETPAARDEAAAAPATDGLGKGLGVLGLCLGASVAVIGGAMGIGRIGGNAVEAIARQPEAAGSMFLAWLLPAAMIEGAMLFAVVVCYLAMGLFR